MSSSQTRQLASEHLLKQRYRIIRRIGEGGFGAVYKAEDTHLGNRVVAIKEMSQQGLSPQEIDEATTAFRREALLLAGLTHPNLPRIYEHFTENGQWYLVMDFIEGETLEEHIQNSADGRLSVKEALTIAAQLCTVLDYLHTRQPPIIFRDLKPANIILTPHGQLYLIDFGIARHFKPGQLKDTIAFGSPGYAAPEQYGKKQTTPRADIYSLGTILHQMLTGCDPSEEPFHFVSPRAYNTVVPFELATLVMQMVELDVDKRPSSATDVKQRLQQIATEQEEMKRAVIASPTYSRHLPAPSATQLASPTSVSTPSSRSVNQVMYSPSPPAAPQKKGGRVAIALFLLIAILEIASCISSTTHTTPTYQYSPTSTPYEVSSPDLTATVSTLSLGDTLPITDVGESTGPVVWSPDGQYVAYVTPQGSGDVGVRGLFNRYSNILFTGEADNHVSAIAWTDSTHIIGVSTDEKVYVWDIAPQDNSSQGNPAALSHHAFTGTLTAVAWSPDEQYKYIASAEDNGTISVWNALTGATIVTYTTQSVRTLAWSPKGKLIAFASNDDTVQVWDTTRDKIILVYHGHAAPVNALAWSPDGKRIASASDDKTVQVWDASSGGHVISYRNHTDHVLTLAWSHDGEHIASGGADQTVQIWNAATGEVMYTYPGHSAPVQTLTWSPDDTFIASTSNDTSLQVWKAK